MQRDRETWSSEYFIYFILVFILPNKINQLNVSEDFRWFFKYKAVFIAHINEANSTSECLFSQDYLDTGGSSLFNGTSGGTIGQYVAPKKFLELKFRIHSGPELKQRQQLKGRQQRVCIIHKSQHHCVYAVKVIIVAY